MQSIGLKKYVSRYGKTCVTNRYWLNLWSDVTRDINDNKLILFSVKNEDHVYVGVGYSEERRAIYSLTNLDGILMKWVPLEDAYYMCSVDIY